MAEQPLIVAMEEEIAARVAEIDRQADAAIREAEADVDRLLAEAEERETARVEQRFRDYARQQRARRENERRARIANLQFEVAQEVLEELARAVGTVRDREDYAAVWSRLLDEAMQVYGEERDDAPVLRVAPVDCPLADRCRDRVAAVEPDAAVDAGLELVSRDSRLRVRNTLLSRIHRGREEFLKMISDALEQRISLGDGP